MTDAPVKPDVLCQQALARVLTYLGDDGVELGAENCRQALRLVESALAAGMGPDLPARCVADINRYFERPSAVIPEAAPPLMRGPIGYHQNG